jgi:hypothetical protein
MDSKGEDNATASIFRETWQWDAFPCLFPIHDRYRGYGAGIP